MSIIFNDDFCKKCMMQKSRVWSATRKPLFDFFPVEFIISSLALSLDFHHDRVVPPGGQRYGKYCFSFLPGNYPSSEPVLFLKTFCLCFRSLINRDVFMNDFLDRWRKPRRNRDEVADKGTITSPIIYCPVVNCPNTSTIYTKSKRTDANQTDQILLEIELMLHQGIATWEMFASNTNTTYVANVNCITFDDVLL